MGNEFKIKAEQDDTKEHADKKYEKWEIEDAIRILVRAEEIKADKEMMALIAPKLKEKAVAINNAANILYGERVPERKAN
ncbi:hypothetical protein IJ425_04220 [bacterium]|nr:hypothetical protein [bacterium]